MNKIHERSRILDGKVSELKNKIKKAKSEMEKNKGKKPQTEPSKKVKHKIESC